MTRKTPAKKPEVDEKPVKDESVAKSHPATTKNGADKPVVTTTNAKGNASLANAVSGLDLPQSGRDFKIIRAVTFLAFGSGQAYLRIGIHNGTVPVTPFHLNINISGTPGVGLEDTADFGDGLVVKAGRIPFIELVAFPDAGSCDVTGFIEWGY